jgi:hypothetical protein
VVQVEEEKEKELMLQKKEGVSGNYF